MAAWINIVGWPQGATILVNDVEIGELPIYNYMLKWGKYKIEARKEGYVSEFREEFVIWPTDRSKTIVIQMDKVVEEG